MKKILSVVLISAMVVSLSARESKSIAPPVAETKAETTAAETKADDAAETETTEMAPSEDFHIGIAAGSVSQFEDDRHGTEEFQGVYGEDTVKLTIYPDNFTEELETTIQTTVDLSDDPRMKAIVVSQPVSGIAEALRKTKESRPDTICITGKVREDLPEIGSATDLVYNSDLVVRGYLITRTAYELDCDTFVHISFPRHMAYETMSRRVVVMKEACEEFGMEFVLKTAPDPTSDVGVAGAQAYILEKVPEWIEKYGKNVAYFCTNDAYTEPLLKRLMEYGEYFVEADLPPPLMGYPEVFGIGLAEEAGDFNEIPARVESTIVERGGANHFGTWAYSYGYTTTADLVRHAMNALKGESELTDIDDIAKACQVFFPKAKWNGSNYTNVETGVKSDKVFLVHRDTYIMGDPGHFMGSTEIEASEKYSTVK